LQITVNSKILVPSWICLLSYLFLWVHSCFWISAKKCSRETKIRFFLHEKSVIFLQIWSIISRLKLQGHIIFRYFFL
jgi:hypothetical protein